MLTDMDLKYLKLQNCFWLTEGCMEALTLHHHNIEEVDLMFCWRLNDSCVSNLMRSCSRLRLVNLSFIFALTDITMVVIGECCKLLEHLNIKGCWQVTDRGISPWNFPLSSHTLPKPLTTIAAESNTIVALKGGNFRKTAVYQQRSETCFEDLSLHMSTSILPRAGSQPDIGPFRVIFMYAHFVEVMGGGEKRVLDDVVYPESVAFSFFFPPLLPLLLDAVAVGCRFLKTLFIKECKFVTEHSLDIIRDRVYIDMPRLVTMDFFDFMAQMPSPPLPIMQYIE
uniref:Uncharacterized protein n=1 Tax=Timema bartmani TaxID=61472 RepID=A0A7R9I5K4_9NEOP|nr:unnamed protein product [Timema bartmani]